MDTDDEFRQYILVADALLEQASREQLVEALKLLALNMGYLVQRYSDMPQDLLLRMTQAETPTEETQELVITSMHHLLGLLGSVMAVGDEDETRHYSTAVAAFSVRRLCGYSERQSGEDH